MTFFHEKLLSSATCRLKPPTAQFFTLTMVSSPGIIPRIIMSGNEYTDRYAYDATGRRVRKTVDLHNGTTWAQESDTHYTYWDWNVIGNRGQAMNYDIFP